LSWRVGVIWKGDKLIDGVPETLDLLRSKVCREL
jgi:ribonucleotide monophosphatase NagD (HAD superfamily)